MLVLITYDVNTEDAGGRRRLRKIAKECVNYGQRVQNSVFECLVDPAQCTRHSAESFSTRFALSLMTSGTVCGFTISAISIRRG